MDLEQSQLSMMLQKAEFEESLIDARAALADSRDIDDKERELLIKHGVEMEYTAARRKAAQTESRLKGVVTALNRDLELSQLGAMTLQAITHCVVITTLLTTR